MLSLAQKMMRLDDGLRLMGYRLNVAQERWEHSGGFIVKWRGSGFRFRVYMDGQEARKVSVAPRDGDDEVRIRSALRMVERAMRKLQCSS